MNAALTLASVDEVIAWFNRGRRPEGLPSTADSEGVSMVDHGLQCAELLAAWFPDDPELQVAGLLHDLAHHFLVGVAERPDDHEMMHGIEAGDAVRGLFGHRIAALIELHVPAKRYLASFDPAYGPMLSAVSTYTLGRQGGLMDSSERAEFEALPDWDAAVQLRRADDLAKTPAAPTRSLDEWRPVLQRLALTSAD